MVEIDSQELREGIDVSHQVDLHREIAAKWIAAAIAGIQAMHSDESVRRLVAVRLF